MDLKKWLGDEWAIVVQSKTFKLVMGVEAIAVPTFVWGLIDGSIPSTKQSLIGFVVAQAILVGKLLHRNTMAGIEAKVDAVLGAGTSEKLEKAAVQVVEEKVAAKDAVLADVVRKEVDKPLP